MEFTDLYDDPFEVDLVVASAVVEINQEAFLYVGFVVDYELDERGGLAQLTLQRAFRRMLADDRVSNGDERKLFDEDERYYRIEGDYFFLDCKKARNLNLEYLYFS